MNNKTIHRRENIYPVKIIYRPSKAIVKNSYGDQDSFIHHSKLPLHLQYYEQNHNVFKDKQF